MSGHWFTRQTGPGVVHAVPLDDGIVHEYAADCPCGPAPLPTTGGTVHCHHSLDGREHHQPDHRSTT